MIRTMSMFGSSEVMNLSLRASVASRSGTNIERMTWRNAYGLDTDSNLPLSIRLLVMFISIFSPTSC